jgi:hypothetical protein
MPTPSRVVLIIANMPGQRRRAYLSIQSVTRTLPRGRLLAL